MKDDYNVLKDNPDIKAVVAAGRQAVRTNQYNAVLTWLSTVNSGMDLETFGGGLVYEALQNRNWRMAGLLLSG